MCTIERPATSNPLQDQNMAIHEQFPVKHKVGCHRKFAENVYRRIHWINQNRQSSKIKFTCPNQNK